MPATIGASQLETEVICDGTGTLVVTTQTSGETLADFEARHVNAVENEARACNGNVEVEPATYTTPVTCGTVTENAQTTQQQGQAWAAFVKEQHLAIRALVEACN